MTANPSKPQDSSNRRSPSSDSRRANKPLMEKRRRARINQSLNILKTLIVDTSREKKPSKLEKADILELTVSFLQKNQDKNPAYEEQRFSEGYQECSKAAVKFLESCNIDQTTLEKLIEFLQFRRISSNNLGSNKTDDHQSKIPGDDHTFVQKPTSPALSMQRSPSLTYNILKSEDANINQSQNVPRLQSEDPKLRNIQYHKPTNVYSSSKHFQTVNVNFLPVNLSKESYLDIGKSNSNPVTCNKLFLNSDNSNGTDQPLDLSTYSTRFYDETGMWRPW